MKKTYPGRRYIFEVESEHFKNKFYFSITAVHKKSKKYSCINTLNRILSDFGIDISDARKDYSEWLLSPNEHRSFQKKSQEYLTDPENIDYLESKLDEDRTYGNGKIEEISNSQIASLVIKEV